MPRADRSSSRRSPRSSSTTTPSSDCHGPAADSRRGHAELRRRKSRAAAYGSFGADGADLELNAIEFCRLVSGRGHADGVLTIKVRYHDSGSDLMSERRRIREDLIGLRRQVPIGWEPVDAVVFALATGADPVADLDYLDIARGPYVLPTLPFVRAAR